jgi:serine O-acetyltransferase
VAPELHGRETTMAPVQPSADTGVMGNTASTDRQQTLWEQLKEDYDTNLRDWSSPGFRALAVYRFGAWRLRQRSWVRRPLFYVWRSLHRYVRNRYGIELHGTAALGRRVRIAHQGAIVIHPHATIGDDCLIRQGVTIGAAAGDAGPGTAPTLERGVELGAGAVVAGKIRIGEGARIGPNVAVTRNVPAGAIVVAPAPRTIFTRPNEETA